MAGVQLRNAILLTKECRVDELASFQQRPCSSRWPLCAREHRVTRVTGATNIMRVVRSRTASSFQLVLATPFPPTLAPRFLRTSEVPASAPHSTPGDVAVAPLGLGPCLQCDSALLVQGPGHGSPSGKRHKARTALAALPGCGLLQLRLDVSGEILIRRFIRCCPVLQCIRGAGDHVL